MYKIFKSFIYRIPAALFLIPFAATALLSLSQQWLFPDVLPEQLTVSHWMSMLNQQSGLMISLGNSIVISSLVAFVSTTTGYLLSRVMGAHLKNGLVLTLTYLPFVLSPVIFASVLNYYFISLNLSGKTAGVMLAQSLITIPFSLLLFAGFWDSKLKAMEELVLTLGGNSRQALVRVLLPVSKNMLLLCFFQTFLLSWFDYGLTSVIGVGKIKTLTLSVFQYVTEANPYYAAVSSCLLIFPPVILLLINKKILFNTLRS